MKSSAIISTTALIGLSSAACQHGTITSGGEAYPLGVCQINQRQSIKTLCIDGAPNTIIYKDTACQAEQITLPLDASDYDEVNCEAVEDCDYIVYEHWMESGETCRTYDQALAANLTSTGTALRLGTSGHLNKCATVDGMKWNVKSAKNCTADATGDIVTIEAFEDNQCKTTIDSKGFIRVNPDGTPMKSKYHNFCYRMTGCSSEDILATGFDVVADQSNQGSLPSTKPNSTEDATTPQPPQGESSTSRVKQDLRKGEYVKAAEDAVFGESSILPIIFANIFIAIIAVIIV